MQQPPVKPAEGYAQYPRGTGLSPELTSAKLRALSEGYYGLNWIFLAHIGLSVLMLIVFGAGANSMFGLIGGLLLYLAINPTVIGYLTYPKAQKIGYGLNWAPSQALTASILMGVNTVIGGLIGYIIFQMIALQGIKAYPVKRGMLGGIRKKDIMATVAMLEDQERRAPSAPAPPPFI